MRINSRYKIVDKKRFTLFCTAAALVFFGIVFTVLGAARSVDASQNTYTVVYVAQGDTLWSIAKEYYPENSDIRATVNDIKAVNGMRSSTIYPGDALYIPVY